MNQRKLDCFMDSLHFLLKVNNLVISEEERKKADEFIKKIIIDADLLSKMPEKAVSLDSPIKISDDTAAPLLLHYYAYTQGNVNFLKKLENINYKFHETPYHYKMFALEKAFTSNFDENEYIDLLINNNKVMINFSDSLLHTHGKEREEYIKRFSKIMRENPDIVCSSGNKDKKYEHLLTKRNMDVFGDEFLQNATDAQKQIINGFIFRLNDSIFDKIKTFLEKYPDTIPNVELNPTTIKFFTIEELANLSLKDANLFEIALKRGLGERLRNILLIDHTFVCSNDFISEEIFNVLDDEDIVNLTVEAKKELIELKTAYRHPNMVIPQRKINGVVFRDNRRKKKMKDREGFSKIR